MFSHAFASNSSGSTGDSDSVDSGSVAPDDCGVVKKNGAPPMQAPVPIATHAALRSLVAAQAAFTGELGLVVKQFMGPLLHLALHDACVTQAQVQRVFRNWSVLVRGREGGTHAACWLISAIAGSIVVAVAPLALPACPPPPSPLPPPCPLVASLFAPWHSVPRCGRGWVSVACDVPPHPSLQASVAAGILTNMQGAKEGDVQTVCNALTDASTQLQAYVAFVSSHAAAMEALDSMERSVCDEGESSGAAQSQAPPPHLAFLLVAR